MRRLLGGSLAATAALLLLGLFTGAAHAAVPHCYKTTALCAEPVDSIGYGGAYTGHDEPSLLFYSNTAGSGNSNLYHLQVPSDPKVHAEPGRHRGHLELPAPSGLLARHGAVRQPVRAGVHARTVHARTATPTSSTATNEALPDYIGNTRARRSSRCSSTRPAGHPGLRESAATRPSGAPRWRSSACSRTRTRGT